MSIARDTINVNQNLSSDLLHSLERLLPRLTTLFRRIRTKTTQQARGSLPRVRDAIVELGSKGSPNVFVALQGLLLQ